MASNTFGPSALATPANAVTVVRLLLTPVLLVMIAGGGPGWGVLAFWTVMSGTDWLDGWLARRQGTTRCGAFLDPLADKAQVLGALGALVVRGTFWWVPVTVIAAREVAMSCYRSWVGRRGVSVPARLPGKVKMWVQAIVVGLAIAPVAGGLYRAFWVTVLWVAVALTVATGVQYAWDGRRVIRGL